MDSFLCWGLFNTVICLCIFVFVLVDGLGAWKFLQFIDQKPQETSSVQSSGVAAARALFQSKTSRGQESKSESDVLWTQHEAAISDMKTLKDPFMVSTSAMDGRVVVWNLPSLQVQMSSLSL